MSWLGLALQTGKSLISYYPVLLPCLYVFYYESFMSLQLWRAVNLLQRCEPQYDDVDERSRKPESDRSFSSHGLRDVSLGAFLEDPVGILFMSALIPAIILSSLGIAQWTSAIKCLLFVPFTMGIIVWKLALVPFQFTPPYVGLDDLGHLTVVITSSSPIPFLEFIVFPVLAAIYALYYECWPGVAVVEMGIFYSLVGHAFPVPLLIRNIRKFKKYVIFEVILGALGITGVLILRLCEDRQEYIYASIFKEAVVWEVLVICSATLVPSFIVLCMLLRFDFIQSQAYVKDQNINPGPEALVFLTYNPPTFPSPYHILAFCILGGSFVLLAFLSATFQTKFRIEELGFFVGSIATPAMVFSALIMAAMKGQLRDLWEYKDDWGSRVQKSSLTARIM